MTLVSIIISQLHILRKILDIYVNRAVIWVCIDG
jgi:hypothetical protein